MERQKFVQSQRIQNLLIEGAVVAIYTEPYNTNTRLVMTKDQGQKPAHNDSSLQTDDNQTNGTESSLNNNCEVILFLFIEMFC